MKIELVDDWVIKLWHSWAIRTNAVIAGVAAAVVAAAPLTLGLIAFLPEKWRWLAALLTGLVVFVLPSWARLAKQPKLAEKIAEKHDAAAE